MMHNYNCIHLISSPPLPPPPPPIPYLPTIFIAIFVMLISSRNWCIELDICLKYYSHLLSLCYIPHTVTSPFKHHLLLLATCLSCFVCLGTFNQMSFDHFISQPSSIIRLDKESLTHHWPMGTIIQLKCCGV